MKVGTRITQGKPHEENINSQEEKAKTSSKWLQHILKRILKMPFMQKTVK